MSASATDSSRPLKDRGMSVRRFRRQPIAEAADRFDETVADLAAQPGDDDLDRVRVDFGVAVVDALENVAAGDDMLLAQHEAGEHAPFERRQAQRQAIEAEGPELRVIGDGAADDQRRGMAGRAADKRAQPHHDFLHAERLDEIIVGAGLEAFDLFGPPVARSEDQHGQFAARRAPGPQHGDPVDFRQAEIEHGGVIDFRVAQMLAVLAVGRDVDDEILRPQRAGDRVGQKIVVLDEKDFHVGAIMKGRVPSGAGLTQPERKGSGWVAGHGRRQALVQQRGLIAMSTSETPTSSLPPPEPPRGSAPFRSGRRSPALFAALSVAFAIGGGVTAAALQARRPSLVMLTPAPITSMHDWSEVAVKGQVAEIFGNKFIVQDDSGRALVDTGRRAKAASSSPSPKP